MTMVDFCEDIYALWLNIDEEDDQSIEVIAHYSVIQEIVNTLVYNHEEFEIVSIDNFAPFYVNGYKDEYVLAITWDGQIWIEPAKVNDKYLNLDMDNIQFIDENCSSKIMSSNPHCDFEEFFICDGECECCDRVNDDENEDDDYNDIYDLEYNDDDNHNYNYDWKDKNGIYSVSFYSTDSDLVNLFKKFYNEFI